MLFGRKAWNLCLVRTRVIQTGWNEVVTQEALRSKGSQFKKCQWHVRPRALSHYFSQEGWGLLFYFPDFMGASLGSDQQVWKCNELVFFLESCFCCLLNHLWSAWATIFSPARNWALVWPQKTKMTVIRHVEKIYSFIDLLLCDDREVSTPVCCLHTAIL